jgi:hypothetical protein
VRDFDLYHFGAEIAQHLRAQGTRQHPRSIQHADAGERQLVIVDF